MELIAIVACICVCTYLIIKAVVPSAYTKYDAFIMMAFSWVEKTVPDDYGASEDDPAMAKMVHKVDLFLKKFQELTKQFTGEDANKNLINYALNLSAKLATK